MKMGKIKEYEIQIPIQGKMHIFKTDLICNSCGSQIQNGEYLYFCVNDKDDLCSKYECLKKHVGHQFFRWGKVQLGSDPKTQQLKVMITSSLTSLVPKRPAPPMALPTASAPGAPPAPTKGPLVNTAMLSLRSNMLTELKRLKCIMEAEDEGV